MARASLEELRLDYEDFLRQRGLPLWTREDARRQELIDRRCSTAEEVVRWVGEVRGRSGRGGHGGLCGPDQTSTVSTSSTSSTFPEIAANAALTLIAVATALLDRQLAAQASAFETEGGFTERLYRIRRKRRNETCLPASKWYSLRASLQSSDQARSAQIFQDGLCGLCQRPFGSVDGVVRLGVERLPHFQ